MNRPTLHDFAGTGWTWGCLAVALVVGSSAAAVQAAPQASQDPAPVRAALVRRQVIHQQRSFVGTVTPIRQSIIGSAVEGRLQQLFVEEGDVVRPQPAEPTSTGDLSGPAAHLGGDPDEAGFPLAQLRTATVDIELEAARSELNLRLAMQAELTTSLPADLDLARATLGSAQARLQYSAAEWERGQRLAANGSGISQSELDLLRSGYDAAVHDLAAAKSAVLKLENTQQARLAQATAQVNNQREALRLLEDRRSKYTVRAPFEGIVSRRIAEEGQWITTGADVAEVVQMNPIDVVIMVPQAMLPEFQYSLRETRMPLESRGGDPSVSGGGGSTATGRLEAKIVADSQPLPLVGYVHALVPTADLMSRSFPVKIRLENPLTDLGYQLNPGMLVKVELTVGQVQQRLMVDKDALVLNNNGKFLMVIDRTVQPHVVTSVPVQVGTAVANHVEVIGAVPDDAWIVIEGNERLRTGNPVKVLNAEALQQATPARQVNTAEIAGVPN